VEALETLGFDPYSHRAPAAPWSAGGGLCDACQAKARMERKCGRLKEGAVQQTQGHGEPVFGQRRKRGFRRFLLRGLRTSVANGVWSA